MSPDVNTTQSQGVAQAPVYVGEAPREMIEAGVFYGRAKSKTNPKMRPFIFGTRGGVEIINLQRTNESLDKAMAFIVESVRNNKALGLLVGTEPAADGPIMDLAKKFSLPFVSTRWVGGTLTNFKIISGRIDHLKKTRSDLATGGFDKYTKKERLEIEREVHRLEALMGGLEALSREPDFMIIVNPVVHLTAVQEARRRNIPIIAFANVDANPDIIEYLVPGNDKAKSSVVWFLEKVEKAFAEGLAKQVPKEPAAPAAS